MITFGNTNPFYGSHMISTDELTAISNIGTANLIRSVSDLVFDNKIGLRNCTTINMNEAAAFASLMKTDIDNATSILNMYNIIIKGRTKIIYCDDLEFSYTKVRYSSISNVSGTSVSNHINTFIVGNIVESEPDEFVKLAIDIIDSLEMTKIWEIGITSGYISNDMLELPADNHSITDAKLFVDYYTTLFSLLDAVMDLKYDDFDKIFSAMSIEDSLKDEEEIIHKIYNNAIDMSYKADSLHAETIKFVYDNIL